VYRFVDTFVVPSKRLQYRATSSDWRMPLLTILHIIIEVLPLCNRGDFGKCCCSATADLTERRFVLQFPAPVGIMFESLRA